MMAEASISHVEEITRMAVRIAVTLFLLSSFVLQAGAQEKFLRSWSIEIGSGFSYFNGSEFEHDSSIKEHPARLGGITSFGGLRYDLPKHLFVEGLFSRGCVSGHGPWLRNTPEAQAAMVVGDAHGRTVLCESTIAPLFGAEHSFHGFVLSGKIGPSFEKITTTFSGEFTGSSPLGPIMMPAFDHDVSRARAFVANIGIEHSFRGISPGIGYEWDHQHTLFLSLRFQVFTPLSRSK